MNISVIGTGYVGLVAGACLSDFGSTVTCVDTNSKKISDLQKGIIPIFEPGLTDIVVSNHTSGRLQFTKDVASAIKNSEVIFIAVGTPPRDDGSADLQYVLSVADDIAAHMNGYKVIVDKSTVPIGTARFVRERIQKGLDARGVDYTFDVVSNPEFLREGSAVYDFMHPDRIVIGTRSEKARDIMRQVYRVLFLNNTPFVETTVETAEMIKYAANAFLALKITYINEIANLCESVGANVQDVAKSMGMDGRISNKFLHPGPGYGGSCFPKDTKALANIAREQGETISLIEATIKANEKQKLRMVAKIQQKMGTDLSQKNIAVLGITFKPKTDDMRDASALVILPKLVEAGASLKIFDPEGKKEGSWRLEHIQASITFCGNEYEALEEADALIILTEWNQFRQLDISRVKQTMKGRYFFDFRNIYQRDLLESEGFIYDGVGC